MNGRPAAAITVVGACGKGRRLERPARICKVLLAQTPRPAELTEASHLGTIHKFWYRTRTFCHRREGYLH